MQLEDSAVHPSHQDIYPAVIRVLKDEANIDPSHEEITGEAKYHIGDRVSLVSLPGAVKDIIIGAELTHFAPFLYQILFDMGETSNYVPASDLTPLSK